MMAVASIIRLIKNQKLRILWPAALSLLTYVVTRFIKQCIIGNKFMIFQILYDPLSYTNSMSMTILTILLLTSFLLCYLSLIPFLLFNRFYLIAIYCFGSVAIKIIYQVIWIKFWSFDICWLEVFYWFVHQGDISQICKDKLDVQTREDFLAKDTQLSEQYHKALKPYAKIQIIDNTINMLCLATLLLEILWQMFRRRKACFK